MRRICGFAFFLLCLHLLAWPSVAAAFEHSVSASRQFLVYADNVELRGVICDLAERTKRDFLALVDQSDNWNLAILINARFPQPNLPELPRAALNVGQTGNGLKLQLDLLIDSDLTQREVRRELLRAIIVEMAYRNKTALPAGSAYTSPPAWLLDGIPSWQSDFVSAELSNLLQTLGSSNKILLIREFLRPCGDSKRSPTIHLLDMAYSFAFVEFLTHLPDGKKRLGRFVLDLPNASADPLTDLGLHFPELGNAETAERLWKAHFENFVRRQPQQLLTIEDTEEELDKLLMLSINCTGGETKYRLDQFQEFFRIPCASSILVRVSQALGALATRAHPILRPTIQEYANIATRLTRKKTNGISRRLARLKVSRQETLVRSRKISEYMNWFEATKSGTPSGAFSDFLKAAEQRPRSRSKRRDGISTYLDYLEDQVEN